LLKKGVAHGLTVSSPNRDKLTMRINALKTLSLILSLSKDEAKDLCFFSGLIEACLSLEKGRDGIKPTPRSFWLRTLKPNYYICPKPKPRPRMVRLYFFVHGYPEISDKQFSKMSFAADRRCCISEGLTALS
jgi:hypothetical protein